MVKNVIGILSGKGGVGKSTVCSLLAQALAEMGLKPGIFDADIYGPSIPTMLPPDRPMREEDGALFPAYSGNIALLSLGLFLPDGESPAAVRAPIANELLMGWIRDVNWGELDYLLIDFPPGTGDIQLTLMQQMPIAGCIAVTMPQEIALLDVRKAVNMAQKMGLPILGIVENFSYLIDGEGRKQSPFGSGGGRRLAEKYGVPFLGEIPLESSISRNNDLGLSIYKEAPDSFAAGFFNELAYNVHVNFIHKNLNKDNFVDRFEINWKQDIS